MIEETDKALAYLREKTMLGPHGSKGGISNPALAKICADLLRNPRFLMAPAAAKKHQAYEGGLLVHTAEVLVECLCLLDPEWQPSLDRQLALDLRKEISIRIPTFHYLD